MRDWPRRPLGDIAQVVDCEHKTAPAAPAGLEFGYSVGTPHLRDGRIDYAAAKWVTRETYEAWSRRAVLRQGDLILAREAPVGQVALVDPVLPTCLGQRTVLVRPDTELVVDRFLHGYLLGAEAQRWMEDRSTGSTVAHLNVADVREIPVALPPIPEQHRIASLLCAFDDLIETNRTLVERLVAEARIAFERFSPTADQSLTYADVVDIAGGGTPSTKTPDFWDGDIRWATPSDMTALPSPFLFDTGRKITVEGLDSCSSALYPAGSILMTSRATIGVFAVAQVPTALNQGFIVVQPRSDADGCFLLLEMMSRVPDYLAHANGSTFLEISRGKFKALPVSWPSVLDRERLHAEAEPLLTSAAQLETEIADLIRTRDDLLPLLMSGTVRVAEVEAVA